MTLSFDISDISMVCEESASPFNVEGDAAGSSAAVSPATSTSETTTLPAIVTPKPRSINAGYKIVFDNLDKTIKPRYMSIEKQSTSLHYVHGYAVKDRIDFSTYSAANESGKERNVFSLLPAASDYATLKRRFSIHVTRIITSYLTFFTEDFEGLVNHHIKHRYSTEMGKKSEVVSQIEFN